MMDAADAEYLLSKLEENEDGGYDYSTFVKVAYGKQEAPADFYSRPVGGLTPRPDGTPRTRGTTMSAAPAAAPAPAPAPAAPAPAVRHANRSPVQLGSALLADTGSLVLSSARRSTHVTAHKPKWLVLFSFPLCLHACGCSVSDLLLRALSVHPC
jgi:hypothetical protein